MASFRVPTSNALLTVPNEHTADSSSPSMLVTEMSELRHRPRSRSPSPGPSIRSPSPALGVSSAHPPQIYFSGAPHLRSRGNVASRPPSLRCPSPVSIHPASSRASIVSFHPTPSRTSVISHHRAPSTTSVVSASAVRIEDPDGQPVPNIARPSHPVVGPDFPEDKKDDVQDDVQDDVIRDEELKTITPNDLEDQKYTQAERMIPTGYKGITTVTHIPAGKTEFTHYETAILSPTGWQRSVAPEGNVFYYNKEKRIYTISNMAKSDDRHWIEEAYHKLNITHARKLFDLPDDTDIVLDYSSQGYYLTSWTKQCVFWLSETEVEVVTSAMRPTLSETHLQHMMINMFWCVRSGERHVATFPNFYALTKECVSELKAAISFGHADILSSETSLFPYDIDMTIHITRFLDKIDVSMPNAYYTNAFARYMDIFTYERFLFFYGESYARLSRDEGALEECRHSEKHSSLFRFFTPLLFWQPQLYFSELNKVYADQTVHYHSWRKFISVLKNDWEISLTPATVMLSANVGFLAIQSIDNSPDSPQRSAAQIASYISSLFGLANMAVVQILLRRHRQHLYDTAARGLEFLAGREDKLGGLEMLAITVSLPPGLFGWSMLSFLVALLFIFYHNTTFVTKIVLSVFEAILLVVAAILFLGGKIGKMPRMAGLWQVLAGWPTKLLRAWPAIRSPERRNSGEDQMSFESEMKTSTTSFLTLRKAFSRSRKNTDTTIVGP